MQAGEIGAEPGRLDRLRKYATPVALVVMAWIVLGMLYQLGLFLLVDGQGPFGNAGWSPFGAWEAFVLGVVVSVTVLWARPRQAPALVLAAIVVASVGVVLQIGSLIVSAVNLFNGLSEPGFALLEVLRMVLNLVLPVVVLLWLIALRSSLADAADRRALPQSSGPAPAWQPEQARGAHWSTASGAATGSAASDWGTPGQPGGWGPPTQNPASWPPPQPEAPAYDQPAGQQHPHQPRPPEQFGPQALAEQYGRPVETDEQTRLQRGRQQPPQWTPLDRGEGQ